MRTPRLYFPNACQPGEKAELSPEQAHHVLRVLRRTVGDSLVLFDGTGQSFEAKVCSTAPRGKGGQVEVLGKAVSEAAPITPLRLAQAMLKSDTLDYVLQKATELGVSSIQLLVSDRSESRLNDASRLVRRLLHWRGILIAACEQCGRNWLPELLPPTSFAEWIADPSAGERWLLDPNGAPFADQTPLRGSPLTLAIGPEGGWHPDEVTLARSAGIKEVSLGPRILRADTAPVVALALVQHSVGGF